MIVLGVDPGLATLGWGVIEADGEAAPGGLWLYSDHAAADLSRPPARSGRICAAAQRYRPDEIAFEEFFRAQRDHGADRGRGDGA